MVLLVGFIKHRGKGYVMVGLKNYPVLSRVVRNKYAWKRTARDLILGLCAAIILVGVCYTILAPVIGVISVAFMSVEDVFNPLVYLVPENASLNNIRNAINYMDFWRVLRRTLSYALGMALLHVVMASFIGYGFARFRFPFRSVMFGFVIFSIVIPVQTYMVPLWIQFRFFGPTEVNLIGSYMPMIILAATGVGMRSGLFIYIFRQFFRGMPTEISEAALIDGAGPLRTYAQVMMPNAKPAIITVLLFSLVWHYGDTVYSGQLMAGIRFLNISLGGLMQQYMIGTGVSADYMRASMVMFGGVLLVVAPIMIIYAVLQRQFIEGIERSGIVG